MPVTSRPPVPTRRRRLTAGVAALIVAGSALVAQSGVDAGATAAVDPAGAKSWTSTEGGSDAEQVYSSSEATALAKRFDMILGLKTTFMATGLTPTMKAANPNLKMIVYTNGTHAKPSEATGLAESWFAHDTSGARVMNVPFGNYVMNPRSTGWQGYVATRCTDFMNRMDADGCYLDDMGVGNLTTNFSAVPVDPNTGSPYTEAGWMDATSTLAGAVETRLEPTLVFANGLNNGARYFGAAQSWRMIARADGAEAEGFVRGESQALTEFRKETVWKQDVDMLVDAGARGKAVLAKTKIWIPASSSAVDRWHRYTLATFMLGTDGNSYLAFNAKGPGKPEAERALERLDLGHPTAPYAKVGGMYSRTWSKGNVYVNPTTASATVTLDGQYRTLDGDLVTSLTLAPNTADILTFVAPTTTTTTQPPTTTTTQPPTTTTTAPPTTTTTQPPAGVTCDGVTATIVGTSGNDLLTGTAGRDVIAGLGGNDIITGLDGNDLICGGSGADAIDAGAGNDVVIGGSEDDTIYGRAGTDVLRGWAGADRLDGGGGVDTVDGGAASNTCVDRPNDTYVKCATFVAP